ncbi:MAG: hypothetical protein ABIP49_05855 [Lysobacterales bacterium]
MRSRLTMFLTLSMCAWAQPTLAATDLARVLSCNDWAFIATEPELLRPALQSLPGVTCERTFSRDGEMLECLSQRPVTAFGQTVREFSLGRVNRNVHRLRFVLPVPLEQVRAVIEREVGARFEPDVKLGYLLKLPGVPERSYRLDLPEDGVTELICQLSIPNESSAAEATDADAEHGAISGAITFPSKNLPPMRVCAVPTDHNRSAERRCELTASGQNEYALGNLAAGEYYIIAYPQRDNPNGWIMGHADALGDCGEGRPDCAGALLKRVVLRGDQVLEHVDIVQAFTGLAPHLSGENG